MKNWENHVRKVIAYVAGGTAQEQDVIKLNTNENPYPPAPGVGKSDTELAVRKYPDPGGCLRLPVRLQSNWIEPRTKCLSASALMMYCSHVFSDIFNSGKPVCSRILHPSFMMYGRTWPGYPMNVSRWTKILYQKEDYMKPNGGIVLTKSQCADRFVTTDWQ